MKQQETISPLARAEITPRLLPCDLGLSNPLGKEKLQATAENPAWPVAHQMRFGERMLLGSPKETSPVHIGNVTRTYRTLPHTPPRAGTASVPATPPTRARAISTFLITTLTK